MNKAALHFSYYKVNSIKRFISDMGYNDAAYSYIYSSLIKSPNRTELNGIEDYNIIRLAWSLIKCGYGYNNGCFFPPENELFGFVSVPGALAYGFRGIAKVV